jgi:hypothetical protein
MKRLLLLALLALGLFAPVAPASAACSVNSVPATGVTCAFLRDATYSATAVGLVPAAAATDIFCISGSATKIISVRKISIGGTAGTAITTPFLIYQRSALDTAGTPATGVALPVPVALNSTDPAPTAVTTAYTANPTVAATPLLMDALVVNLPITTAAGGNIFVTGYYGSSVDNFNKGLDIPKNTTLQTCINLNGATVSSGVLVIHMEWTEN